MAISRTRAFSMLFIVLGISLLWTGCGENPVTPTKENFEARGMVLKQSNEEIVVVDSGVVAGAIDLVAGAGQEIETFSVQFIREEDGSRGIPYLANGDMTARELTWVIADTTIAEIVDGDWQFDIRGKKGGETTIVFTLMHGNHADFTSPPIKIRVMEKPAGLVLDMGGTELVRVEGNQPTGQIEVPAGEQSDRIEVWFLDQDGSLFQPKGENHSLAFTIGDTSVARLDQDPGNPWSFRITGLSSGGTTLRIRLQHRNHDDFLSPDILIVTS